MALCVIFGNIVEGEYCVAAFDLLSGSCYEVALASSIFASYAGKRSE
jgi:hypothetical protein